MVLIQPERRTCLTEFVGPGVPMDAAAPQQPECPALSRSRRKPDGFLVAFTSSNLGLGCPPPTSSFTFAMMTGSHSIP